MSWVLRNSQARLGPRLVLIALAEFAHDDGGRAFPSVETLMERSLLSRTGVKDALGRLRDDGHIVETGKTRTGTRIYRIVMEAPAAGGSESDRGRNPTSRGSESGPDPSVNRHNGEKDRARAVRIAGKPVDPAAWALTGAVVAVFNEEARKSLGVTTSAGEPSETAKRVYGRVKAFPDLTVEQHRAIIRATLKSKWWGGGDVSIGVVYGPKVFEQNVDRAGGARAQGVGPPEDAYVPASEERHEFERLLREKRPDDFELWLQGLAVLWMHGERLVLDHEAGKAKWVEERFGRVVRSAAEDAFGGSVAELIVREREA